MKDQDAYLMQSFATDLLPKTLQDLCKPFQDLAGTLLKTLPDNGARFEALKKLLETKDCAVRSALQA